MLRTSFTALCGIRHPIVQAPMAGSTGAAIAHAVSSAGGLGMIAGGYATDRPWLEKQLGLMKQLQSRHHVRYGVGFITHFLQRNDTQQFQIALEHKPHVMWFTAGDASSFAARCRDAGVLVFSQVNTIKDAQLVAAYSDVIVLQGNESGGHGQTCRSLTTLVPAVADVLGPHIPILAAGGIADGRGLVSALSLGAAGVVMGTRFCLTPESLLPESFKQAMLKATGDDTIRSPAIDMIRGPEWPVPYDGRLLSNPLTDRWRDYPSQLYTDPEARKAGQQEYQQHVQTKGPLTAPVIWCGEGIDMVHEILPAADLVNQTIRDAATLIQSLANTTLVPDTTNTPETSTHTSTSTNTRNSPSRSSL